MPFRDGLVAWPLTSAPAGLKPVSLFVGSGDLALEVVVYESDAKPTAGQVQGAWTARRAGRSTPVLVVVLHGGRAWLGGPSGEQLPIHADKDVGAIERLCLAALRQPDRHAAILFLNQALPSLDTSAPGRGTKGCSRSMN